MGYRAETLSKLLVPVRVILAEIPRETLNAAFLEWMERLQKCVQVDDEYVGRAKRTQYIEIDFNGEIPCATLDVGHHIFSEASENSRSARHEHFQFHEVRTFG
jgi:hypothetical protein